MTAQIFVNATRNGTETLVVVEDPPPPSFLARAGGLFRQALQRLSVRREREALDSVDALSRFAHTRAAFVSQKKLYGYLKARMGTRYPTMFEDEIFAASIEFAKWHVFAGCLSDITVHMVARVATAGGLTGDESRALASTCFQMGLEANGDQLLDQELPAAWRATFSERLARIHWENLAAGADAFTQSPVALYRWAPIDEKLKRYDREIVENSIRFAWAEVVRDFRQRALPTAIADDFRRQASGE